jgi:cystathionine beta-lyase
MHEAQQEDLATAFDALSIDELRRRGTAKWSVYDDDVLAAWVAEMDFPLAGAIQAALQDAVARGTTGYAPPADRSGLPAACATWLARSSGLRVQPHQIRILPDVLRGMAGAIEAFSRPQSAVVVMTPAYPPFFEITRAIGREVVEVPMATAGGRATFDLPAVDAALCAGAGTVLLCNPHNPLGRVFTRDELAALAEVVAGHDARVVADEVHSPIVYPGATHVCYATVSDAAAQHAVTLISASKGWNVPGLKCAQLVLTNEADGPEWARLPFLRTAGASTLGILANRVAYEQGEPWQRAVITYLDGNRSLLAQLLAERLPRIGFTVPEGTYLAWLDCRAFALDDPALFFLQQARVAVSDGAAFGPPGRGWVRLNFATSRAILTSIIEAMAAAVETLPIGRH